jgi:hypothetical protein
MPELRDHEKQSMSKYGKSFTQLHQWMDFPSKGFGKRHRMFRHDPKVTPEEAKKLFGKNADHACLDHIVMDLDEEYKFINNGKNISTRTKIISIRIPKPLLSKIKEYSLYSNMKVNPTIVELLGEGFHQKVEVGTYKMWEKSMLFKNAQIALKYPDKMNRLSENPSILIERDKGCIKCGEKNTSKLNIYHIDRNPMNDAAMNVVILCDACKTNLEKYTFRVHPIRKYIEWLLFS